MELNPDWNENLEAMAAAVDGDEAEAGAPAPEAELLPVKPDAGGVGPGVAGDPKEGMAVSPLKDKHKHHEQSPDLLTLKGNPM